MWTSTKPVKEDRRDLPNFNSKRPPTVLRNLFNTNKRQRLSLKKASFGTLWLKKSPSKSWVGLDPSQSKMKMKSKSWYPRKSRKEEFADRSNTATLPKWLRNRRCSPFAWNRCARMPKNRTRSNLRASGKTMSSTLPSTRSVTTQRHTSASMNTVNWKLKTSDMARQWEVTTPILTLKCLNIGNNRQTNQW